MYVVDRRGVELGWQDRIGVIEAGKFGDLVAVTGHPLADITELERVRFLMNGGAVARNDLSRAEPRPRGATLVTNVNELKGTR